MISDLVFLQDYTPEEVIDIETIYEKGSWFQAKNIDIIPLSQLGEMLGVSDYDSLMKEFIPAIEPEGESVLLAFPSILQEKLTTISDEEIETVAVKWSKIEEFWGFAPVEGLIDYLKRAREFLSQSKEPVYLFWGC